MRAVFLDHCARMGGGELALTLVLAELTEVERLVILPEKGPWIQKLRDIGAQVEVIPLQETMRAMKRQDFNILRVAREVLPMAGFVLRIRSRVRVFKADVIHTNTMKSCIYGGIVGRLAGVPVVWHVRESLSGGQLPNSAAMIFRFLAKILPTSIVANSSATAMSLGRTKAPIHVIQSPVKTPDRDYPRKTPGPIRFCLIARIDPIKGQDIFIEAFDAAFHESDEEAFIVGEPLFDEWAYYDSLRALAKSLGLSERVHFLGWKDDVYEVLAQSDVAIVSSRVDEGFCQVIVQAQLMGLPVVVPDAGGPRELVTHGLDGLLYPKGDTVALADNMKRLTDQTIRETLGSNARERASRTSLQEIVEQIRRILGGLSRRTFP